MTMIRVTPFVPGIARGIVRHHGCISDREIAVVTHLELERLEHMPAGLVVVGAAPFSHPMIRLYGYAIPTVLASSAQAALLREGEWLALDGYQGWLGSSREHHFDSAPEGVSPIAGLPIYTADGVAIEMRASVATAKGVSDAVAMGATTIGMVRSEFIYPEGGRRPDEPFYFAALQQLCDAAAGLRLTIRMLDLAPDKHPGWLGDQVEMRGPLGLRGARLYRYEPIRSVFHAQLRAIGRLASLYDVRVLLPYMTHPEEYAALCATIREVVAEPLQIGVMVETPAAAMMLPEWLEMADFVVIGCNDLMQCLYAADRDIAAVASLLDPYAPALFRLLQQMALSANSQLHRVQLGGLLPQIPGILPVLIGMGYRNFSVEPLLIPSMASMAAGSDTARLGRLAAYVCAAHNGAEVRRHLGLEADYVWGGPARQ